jgi:MFS family permease
VASRPSSGVILPARQAGGTQGFTIAVAAFLPIMAILSLAPAVPTIARHFGSNPAAVTLIPLMVTTPGLVVALLSPFAGWAADRFGRRKILLTATLFYGIFGVAPFFLDALLPIFVSRLAVGVTEAVILTVTNVLVADYFKEDQRRRWLTVQAVVGPVFGTSVVALSGILSSVYWNGAFLIYFVAFPVTVAMFAFFFEPHPEGFERVPSDLNLESHFPWAVVWRYVLVTFFAAILYYVFIVQGGLAFEAIGLRSSSQVGVTMAISTLGVPVGGLLFGYLSKRMHILHVLAIVFASFGIGMLGIGFARTQWPMTAAAFIQQLGSGMCVAGLIFWVSNSISAQHRGRGFGAWTAAFFLGQFVSPAIVSAVRTGVGGILSAFVVMGALGILGAVLLSIFKRRFSSPTAA